VKKQKTIHYGSLEDQERIRLSSLAFAENDAEPKAVGGNINVSNGNNIKSTIMNPTKTKSKLGISIRL